MRPFAACVLVFNDDKILAIKRADNGKYGLPGGKLEVGEDEEAAAIREVKEEAGIDVSDLVKLYCAIDPYEHLTVCYLAKNWSGELLSSDEGTVDWVTWQDFFNNNAFLEYNENVCLAWIERVLNEAWDTAWAE